MYRIEVKPGEEAVFRTIEELATGIRNGFVTPRARIYHAASQKWLPIEFHPHYKKALALPERPKSAPVSTPLPGPVPSFAITLSRCSISTEASPLASRRPCASIRSRAFFSTRDRRSICRLSCTIVRTSHARKDAMSFKVSRFCHARQSAA